MGPNKNVKPKIVFLRAEQKLNQCSRNLKSKIGFWRPYASKE